MKAAPFDYHAPASLADALQFLHRLPNARILAGGQSLVPMMNLRLVSPDNLIDLNQIGDLKGIERQGDRLRIGAMTTQRSIEYSPLASECIPLIGEALFHVGHQQTRNRGTIGGSLCHLDPSAELPVVAAVLDALLTVQSVRGTRHIPFDRFAAGYLTTELEPDEVLTDIEFPIPSPTAGWAFDEFARRPADFAIVGVGAIIDLGADDRVERARLAIAGLDVAPKRVTEVETELTSSQWSSALLDRVEGMVGDLPSEGDENNPACYRQQLAQALTRRALSRAFQRAQERKVSGRV
jgi:carbon-monoxide dehydrogenase medium subunit